MGRRNGITLFRSITIYCRTYTILRNISHIQFEKLGKEARIQIKLSTCHCYIPKAKAAE
jgi:hypothetical protein